MSMPKHDESRRSKQTTSPTGVLESPEVLDWEAHIETPPPRPRGRIQVRLNFRGRSSPLPVDVPDEDEVRKEP